MILKLTYLLAATLMALISGLFYAYACSVNPGLSRLGDAEYLRAMQFINRVILNPWFFASFMGTLVATPLATWMHYRYFGANTSFYLLVAASVVYAVGVFGVTALGNVPLNESLEAFNIGSATAEELNIRRTTFEIPWNRLHAIRTWANVAALVLLLAAVVKK